MQEPESWLWTAAHRVREKQSIRWAQPNKAIPANARTAAPITSPRSQSLAVGGRISRRVIVERSRPSPDRKLAQQGGRRDVELGGQGLDGGGVLGAPVDAVTPIKGSEAVCDAVKSAGGLPLRG